MDPAIVKFFPRNPGHLPLSSHLVSKLGDRHSTLRATAQSTGTTVTICAGGEIDAVNESTWRLLLAEAAAAVVKPGSLIVDVSDIEFMGCCAFAALAEQAAECRERGGRLRLVSNQPAVQRIISACGLSALLPVELSADALLPTASG